VHGGVPGEQYLLIGATGLEELLQFLLSRSGLPSLLALGGGLLLLVSGVATGLASSAGLLSVSLLSLLPLSLSIVPQLLISLFEVLPEVLRPASYGIFADRKSTRLNSSHVSISYAVFCLKKKKISKFNQ